MAFRGWALLPVVGTGSFEDPYRPELGPEQAGDRTEHVIEAGAGRCLVAVDVEDVARLAAGVVLCEHAELATRLASIATARRNRIRNAIAQLGVTDLADDDLARLLARAGRRFAGFEGFHPGLHLGQAQAPEPGSFISEAFTNSDGTTLQTHDAAWTRHTSSPANNHVIASNRAKNNSTTAYSFYYHTATPAGVEYDVACDIFRNASGAADAASGPQARVDTAANTMYWAFNYSVGPRFELRKVVAGTETSLGTYTPGGGIAVNDTNAVVLEIRDAAKKVYVAGVERISSSDNAITAKGKAGLRSFKADWHLDNLVATDAGGAATHERSAAIAATGAVESAAQFFSIFERSAAIAATGAVQSVPQRALLRQVVLGATGAVTATGQRDLLRAVAIAGVGAIAASGSGVGPEQPDPNPLVLRFGETTGTLRGREGGVLSFTETD